ncbi:MAG: peptidoglycan DD-metalloendopeptidase family protein [Acidaminococcaceae bacterium]|nr:peptidoglycan DD-metalloendopeptidase family protein [Acidaminococcaceae bacterium]
MVIRKFISAIVLVAMIFTVAMPTYADSLEDEKAKLEGVQQQLQNKEAERDDHKKEVSNAIDKLMFAQKELAEAKQDLQVVEEQQADLELKIKTTQITIEKNKKEFLKTKKIYSKRLREIYINGQINYLDVLLGAKDFSDFSSRMYLLQRIISSDISLLNKLEKQKQDLADKQQALEENKKELDKVYAEVEAKKQLVETKTAEREAIYATALEEQNRLEQEYNELMESSKNISAMIQNMEQEGTMGSVHGSGRFIWPIHGEITSPFGWRTHPIFGTQTFHSGVDIGADYGDPILAADAGTIIYAGWISGYGNAVMIDHGSGLVTLYGHNTEVLVSVGQQVAQGQIIAHAGSTGNSTGPHCHFEVRLHGEPVNPMNYLP